MFGEGRWNVRQLGEQSPAAYQEAQIKKKKKLEDILENHINFIFFDSGSRLSRILGRNSILMILWIVHEIMYCCFILFYSPFVNQFVEQMKNIMATYKQSSSSRRILFTLIWHLGTPPVTPQIQYLEELIRRNIKYQ